jgi:hypothetical protein
MHNCFAIFKVRRLDAGLASIGRSHTSRVSKEKSAGFTVRRPSFHSGNAHKQQTTLFFYVSQFLVVR